MMLAVEYRVFKAFSQGILRDSLLDSLYPEPFGCALGNILCLLV